VCEYFRRTWTPGFIEGSQCAVFSDPLFLFTTVPSWDTAIPFFYCMLFSLLFLV